MNWHIMKVNSLAAVKLCFRMREDAVQLEILAAVQLCCRMREEADHIERVFSIWQN